MSGRLAREAERPNPHAGTEQMHRLGGNELPESPLRLVEAAKAEIGIQTSWEKEGAATLAA